MTPAQYANKYAGRLGADSVIDLADDFRQAQREAYERAANKAEEMWAYAVASSIRALMEKED